MEATIQAIMIIAAFSLVHERVVEFLRWWITRLPWPSARNILNAATKGAWSWLPAVALAIATNANLLDAFRFDKAGEPQFFADYLHGPPTGLKPLVGCILMGLATTLGSSLWHDLAKGLIDARDRLRKAGERGAAEDRLSRTVLLSAPLTPAASGLVPS